MTLVTKGILGYSSSPASALHSCAAASVAKPHQLVGSLHPLKRYLARLLRVPTADSAVALAFGSYPAVEVLNMPTLAQNVSSSSFMNSRPLSLCSRKMISVGKLA